MPPIRAKFPRSGSAFHQNLSKKDREELLTLQTVRELPKARYATKSCLTVLPSGRGRKVTYSHVEIYKMVEDIATNMRAAGVRPQTVCAFVLESCVEAIVYFLALQWIGAIAVPIDPNLSSEELSAVLVETKALTVVSAYVDEDEQEENELFQRIRKACNELEIIEWYINRSINRGVFLDMSGKRAGEGAAWAGGAGDFKFDPSEISLRFANSEEMKVLQVEMTHGNIASATRAFSHTYDLTAEHATLLVTPFYTIHGLMCVLATMYAGGHVVISSKTNPSPPELYKVAKANKVNWLSTSESLVLSLFEEASANPSVMEGVNLSFIRVTGGNIDTEFIRKAEPVFRAPVLEAYGTVGSCGLVTANREFDYLFGTRGRPITGCDVSIFHPETREKLPAESEGDIGVSGKHIINHYVGNEYANENCFLDVNEGEHSKRYFLTGDRGSLTSNGFLKVVNQSSSLHRAFSMDEQGDGLGAIELAEGELQSLPANEQEDTKLSTVQLAAVTQRALPIEEKQKEDIHLALQDDEGNEGDEVKRDDKNNRNIETSSTSGHDSELAQRSNATTSSDEGSVQLREQNVSVNSNSEQIMMQILQRLDAIERNQMRLEQEIDSGRKLELETLRTQLAELSYSNRPDATAPPVSINMEEINAAVNAAAASAESSSRHTAAAAQEAKNAAKSAATASAAATRATARSSTQTRSENVVEVSDPNALQKTILVSLDDVEEAVRLHVSVEIARAFGRPDPKYGQEVFCVVKPKQGARLSEPWLMLHAQSVLPAAFVPKRFFYKDNLTRDEDRSELSKNLDLKRVAHLSGRSSTKMVKRPSWTPQEAT